MRAPKIEEIKINPEILNLIAELDEFKGRWAVTQSLTPDRLVALRQIATIESVGASMRIEGVKLTNSEIEALLRGAGAYSLRTRDEQEVAGYAELMDVIFNSAGDISFTENYVKQLHSILLKHSSKDERHRGEYKKFPNNVEAIGPNGQSRGVIFQTASPFETPTLAGKLIDWTTTQLDRRDIHPLLTVAIFVVVFLHIHPFQDGNGRLSRALTTLLLLRCGYAYVSYGSFERVVEESKDAYYLALRRGQTELEGAGGSLTDWIVYFLKSMRTMKTTLERKLHDEMLAARLPELSHQILEIIKGRGSSAVAEIVTLTAANRNTVKVHLRRLVRDGQLDVTGRGRGVRYRLR